MFTVQPTKTVDARHAPAWATGLHIVVTHPTPGPGVPQQSTEYVLGEGYADANAGTSGGVAGFGGFGGFRGLSGICGGPGARPGGAGRPHRAVRASTRPPRNHRPRAAAR